MSTEWVRKTLVNKGAKAGVENVHPHRLSHSFAPHYLRNSGDALTLRMLMGNTTLHHLRL